MRATFACQAVLLVALSVAALIDPSDASCCPFCPGIVQTLSEQVAQSDAVALVQWVDATKAEGKSPGSTTYEVLQAVKTPDSGVAKGARVMLDRFRSGRKGDLFLLLGTKGQRGEGTGGERSGGTAPAIDWDSPIEVSEASFGYLTQSPSPEQPTQKRLEYFLKFLEFPDELVANDAYGEFASAPYKDIVPLAKRMPRERLRKWVASSETSVTRLGLYGMMLGLCGEAEDAALMEKKILEPSDDLRLGIDGVMGGYLLLTGEKGLDVLDEKKLSKKAKMPFSETFAAMQAVRFMWTYAEGRIEKERLRQSMRGLLEYPELADLVVADLARWKDWSVQDRLFDLYDQEEYNIPAFKRSIIRYFLASVKDGPQGEGAAQSAHVKMGKELLAKLREKDEQLAKEAERYQLLP